jgi:hypothetical protein
MAGLSHASFAPSALSLQTLARVMIAPAQGSNALAVNDLVRLYCRSQNGKHRRLLRIGARLREINRV